MSCLVKCRMGVGGGGGGGVFGLGGGGFFRGGLVGGSSFRLRELCVSTSRSVVGTDIGGMSLE